MSVGRVTQRMMSEGSLAGLQQSLARSAKLQEQLSTGRIINRPSDSPTDTTSSMRIRSALAEQDQFVRNADDGLAWLSQADSTLSSIGDRVRRARELALQGANTGAAGPQAREALATEVDQIRESLIALGNTTYLDRPIFGGVTAGAQAYDSDGLALDPASINGKVERTVADGVRVAVNISGTAVFGDGPTSLFQQLEDLSADLRAGDSAGIQTGIGALASAGDRVATAQAEMGTRTTRVEAARQAADDTKITMSSSISELENADFAKTVVAMQLQESAYQAALAATGRVMQPSLLDFLR
ncbi:flagellar hook-associated protein FlgL [Nocardioides pacificus]